MTDKRQPEALRLAEQYDYGDPVAHSNMWKAAVCNELRRLHAENERLSGLCDKWNSECDEFREDNKRLAALVEAQQHTRIAELEAELEAVGAGGVQALSAAPSDIAKLRHLYANLKNGGVRDTAQAKRIADGLLAPIIERLEQAAPKAAPTWPSEALVWEALQAYLKHDTNMEGMRAALIVGAAPQQEAQEPTEIPEEIERMAADRYKVVPSHESMFHRWAVVAGTGTQQLYLGREVECQNMARKFAGAFLDGAFVAMQQAAPQQEAQEPAFVDVSLRTAIAKAVYQQVRVEFEYRLCSWTALDADEQQRIVDSFRGLYTAPQPAPTPLSDDVVRDAAFESVRKKLCALPRYSFVLDDDGLVRRVQDRTGNWIEFDDAHELFDPVAVDAVLAAQGGK